MLKWLMLFIGVAHAQTAATFLTQPDLSTCLARSQAQCQLLGCDGVHTQFWWDCQKLTNGQAVIIVQPTGTFAATTANAVGSGGLSSGEQSNLKSPTQLGTALPWVLSIVTFHSRFTPAQITAIVGSTDTVVTAGWNVINGAALVNLQSPSVLATVDQILADGIISTTDYQRILAPTPTP